MLRMKELADVSISPLAISPSGFLWRIGTFSSPRLRILESSSLAPLGRVQLAQ
jgi:hypothetical protein